MRGETLENQQDTIRAEVAGPSAEKDQGGSRKGPLVSIVTPNYNYAHFVAETIRSVLEQDYENIEHITVDDGSTDNSVEVIKQFALRDCRVRLIAQENRGQTAAINVGLRASKGEIIGWINSDDAYCPGVIRKVVSHFVEHPEADLVFGDFNVVDSQGRFVYRHKHLELDYTMGCLIGFGLLITSNSVFWRWGLMNRVGLLDESFRFNMDGEYFSRLAREASATHLDFPIANFRWHDSAKTVTNYYEKTKCYRKEIEEELRRSYRTLGISKSVPYEHSKSIRYVYRMKRILLRFLLGHYVEKVKGKFWLMAQKRRETEKSKL